MGLTVPKPVVAITMPRATDITAHASVVPGISGKSKSRPSYPGDFVS